MDVIQTDVLIVGSGGAGVAAALEAKRLGARVIVVSKDPIGYGDTRLSMGGMSTAPDPNAGDSVERFASDMIAGGDYLNDQRLVHALVENAADATTTYENYGHIFARDDKGALVKTPVPLGGHSFSRTVFSPGSGISLAQSLRAAIARNGIDVWEETVCHRVLLDNSEAVGVSAYHLRTGEAVAILAKSTVIAAGGGGALYYPHTDCAPSLAGDSFGLGLNAGAELVDMEQVQFIPFALTHPECFLGVVVGEPVSAGPFGRLLNAKGEIVLENIWTQTRAKVAGAIMREIEKGGATEHGGLLLDLKPNLDSEIGELYVASMDGAIGSLLRVLRRAYGKKAARYEEPWDVMPSAHYFMGGIKTDALCRSRVPGLYACGQAQGGIMGGNRLGSTSLTELIVFGKRAGETAAREAATRRAREAGEAEAALQTIRSLAGRKGAHRPIVLKNALRRSMWQNAGPMRCESKLNRALEEIANIKKSAQNLSLCDVKGYNTECVDAIELEHMLITAEAIVLSSLHRKESRGAHFRSDLPERDDSRAVMNMVISAQGNKLVVNEIEASR